MKNQVENSISHIILKKMRERGLNQVELAALSGVPQGTISKLLNGTKKVGTKNIFNLLKTLGLLNMDDNCATSESGGNMIDRGVYDDLMDRLLKKTEEVAYWKNIAMQGGMEKK